MFSNFTLFHICISHFLPSTALSSISPPHPFTSFSSLLPHFFSSFLSNIFLYFSFVSSLSFGLHVLPISSHFTKSPQHLQLSSHYSRFLVTWLVLSEESVGHSQCSRGHRLLQVSVTSPIFDDEQL